MEALNPKAPDEIREEIEAERFLRGEDPSDTNREENQEKPMVKEANGKTMMVMLDAKTKITRGKATVPANELKVGDRIVASGPEEKEMITAQTVQIGAAPATNAATKTSGTKAPPK